MWCSTCQQDVPGLGSPSGEGELRCGKCGGGLGGLKPAAAAAVDLELAGRSLRTPPCVEDDWALEAELRGVERLMKSLKSQAPLAGAMVAVEPQPSPRPLHVMGQGSQSPSISAATSEPAQRET